MTRKTALVRRSTLYVPATNEKFIAKAHQRGADAIAVDLEDSIPISRKQQARRMLRSAVKTVGQGGADVLVRINHVPEMMEEDVKAAVCDGVCGFILPKIEKAKDIQLFVQMIDFQAQKAAVNPENIDISVIIESAEGLLNAWEILNATQRIVACWLGNEDFCLNMGIEPSEGGEELLYFKQQLLLAGNVAGVQVMGLTGSNTNFGDLELFEMNARKAASLGFMGSTCIHPAQVPILNKCFTPSFEKVAWAEKVMTAFIDAESKGEGVASLEGKMIDLPVMERAKSLLLRVASIAVK